MHLVKEVLQIDKLLRLSRLRITIACAAARVPPPALPCKPGSVRKVRLGSLLAVGPQGACKARELRCKAHGGPTWRVCSFAYGLAVGEFAKKRVLVASIGNLSCASVYCGRKYHTVCPTTTFETFLLRQPMAF